MSTKRRDRHAANTVALERSRRAQVKSIHTREDWYPVWKGGQVVVQLIPFIASPYGWRVCAWGADDFGLEKDFPETSYTAALKLYEKIEHWTTQVQMKAWGMEPA